MAEIIDLTVSPCPEIIELSSDQENPSTRPSQEQNKRRRKKKEKLCNNGLTNDEVNSSSRPSRAHSPEDGFTSHHRSASPLSQISTSTVHESNLFIFDGTAVPITLEDTSPVPETVLLEDDDNKLLLPSHVLILHEDGTTATGILPPPESGSDDEASIEYLDYEDRKAPSLVRYFEIGENTNKLKPSVFKCKNCGAEGDHKTYECPIQICLTCGAHDEHSTRSCPISKTCYTCGMKGHINKTCPNRFSAHLALSDYHGACDRCGSTEHKINECPTLWRIYQYVNDEDHIVIMRSREEKEWLAIGEGGEEYIGKELWCYNCANSRHLGDDCDKLPHPLTFSIEPSAFSSHNLMSGPFYDPTTEVVSGERGSREQGTGVDWDAGLPVDVGKRGKKKDKEKLEKRFREQEEEGEDWFNDGRNAKRRGMDQQVLGSRGKTFKLGLLKDGGHEPSSSPLSLSTDSGRPSLLSRLSDTHRGKGWRKGDHDRQGLSRQAENGLRIRGAAADPSNRNDRHPHPQTQIEWEGRGSRRGHGPRYRGGYDR